MRSSRLPAAAAAVFLLSVCLSVFILRYSGRQTVEIIRNGVVLYEVDLKEDREIRIPSEDGGYNLIQIRDGTVCVSEADCHDQTCVRMGALKSDYLPIVCLPHKLIVRFAEEKS